MYEHIGIAMSEQSEGMVYLYSAEPQVAAGYQTVDVETESYSYIHCRVVLENYLLNRSLMPSMSKLRVNRSVWSNGLLLAVAMT